MKERAVPTTPARHHAAPRRPLRAVAALTGAALVLTSCAATPGGTTAGAVAPADPSDPCQPQVATLDQSGAYFAAPLIAGAVVIGTGGVLATRPGVIGALVWAASSAAAVAVATTYLEQRRREAAGDAEALARAVGTDMERENAAIGQAQQAMDGVLECRLEQARLVQERQRAGEIERLQAEARLAALRAQAERDVQRARAIEQRIQARAAEIEPAVEAVAPGAAAAAAPARPPAVTARPARPVRLQTAPVAAAAPAAELPARQPVQVRPARTPDFVAVETPSGERLGYAPAAVFAIPPGQMRTIAPPAAAAPAGQVRTLAATNIARRENFREAVADLERAVTRGGFELGT